MDGTANLGNTVPCWLREGRYLLKQVQSSRNIIEILAQTEPFQQSALYFEEHNQRLFLPNQIKLDNVIF